MFLKDLCEYSNGMSKAVEDHKNSKNSHPLLFVRPNKIKELTYMDINDVSQLLNEAAQNEEFDFLDTILGHLIDHVNAKHEVNTLLWKKRSESRSVDKDGEY